MSAAREVLSRYATDPVIAPLLEDFVAALPVQVGEVATALRARRLADAEKLSHRLKGDAATYDLPELSDLADQLERALRAGRLPAPALLAAVDAATARVLAAFPRAVAAP
jgi:HPt (histidine-containing phosphotransfer) domain-containing protein